MNPSLEQEIRTLRSLFWSQRDPEGRAFAPLADAYRRAGDVRHAMELLRDGLDRHPDFLSGHVVAAQLYLEKGLLEEAEIAGRKALELDRENVVAAGIVAEALAAKRARDGDVGVEAPPEIPAEAPPAEAPPEGAVAPDEPVLEMAAAAPEEPAPKMAALAPEPVLEMVAPAPEPAPEVEVVDIAALAPDEPVLEMAAAAPEEPAVEMGAPAPEPEPEPAGPALGDADLPSDELPEEESLVTRTMAELYARQGLNDRALDVYRQLVEASPGDADLRRRAEELRMIVQGGSAPVDEHADQQWITGAGPERPEVETPFAWTAEETPEAPSAGPSVSTYFERLLAWTPGSGVRDQAAPPENEP